MLDENIEKLPSEEATENKQSESVKNENVDVDKVEEKIEDCK